MENRIGPRKRALGWVAFILYLMLLVYLCFFAESMGRGAASSSTYRYNLVPFKEILRYYIHMRTVGMYVFLLNVVGNVVAFIPFGFFRPIIGFHQSGFFKVTIQGALFSLLIEGSQILTRAGSFDVDDIILNTVGAAIGYLIFVLFRLLWRGMK